MKCQHQEKIRDDFGAVIDLIVYCIRWWSRGYPGDLHVNVFQEFVLKRKQFVHCLITFLMLFEIAVLVVEYYLTHGCAVFCFVFFCLFWFCFCFSGAGHTSGVSARSHNQRTTCNAYSSGKTTFLLLSLHYVNMNTTFMVLTSLT